ncbi:hypothetical protein BH09ACT12_BH09ACT12_25900 [soil metagenome]
MELGDQLRVVMTKWGDLPHWEFDALYLGRDEYGDWSGIRAGTPMARPGASFVTETAQVGLVPTPEAGGGGAWLATFHAPGYAVQTYVDMTTVPTWHDRRVHAVDLDLDVIRTAEGRVFVDDEDEFAEHQVGYGYPSEVIGLAEGSCAWVLDAVSAGLAPFDGACSDVWFSVLAGLADPARD